VVFVVTSLATTATSVEAQTIVGRFETRETIDTLAAQSQYAKSLNRIARLAGKQPIENCQFRRRSQPCFTVPEVGVVFAPHFPAAVPATTAASLRDKYLDLLLQRDSPLIDQVGWAPSAQVRSGRKLVADYEERARLHATFGCRHNECLTIVELLQSGTGTGDLHVLGACRVIRIGRLVGPPEFCEAITVQKGSELWLKAVVADIPEGGQGQPDFSINAIGPSNASFAAARDAVRQALMSSPAQLTVQSTPFGFLGVSDRRTSIIDRYFREMLTVRVDWVEGDIFNPQLGRLRFAKAMVSTTVYVNRLNTTDVEDWHLPTREQEQHYGEILMSAVKTAVQKRCAQAIWLDSLTEACGISVPPGIRITLP